LLLRAHRAGADRDLFPECGPQNDLHVGIADNSVDGSRLKALQRGDDFQLAGLAWYCQSESAVAVGDRGEAHALDRDGHAGKRAPLALRGDASVDALCCQRTDEQHDDKQSTSKLQHWQLPLSIDMDLRVFTSIRASHILAR